MTACFKKQVKNIDSRFQNENLIFIFFASLGRKENFFSNKFSEFNRIMNWNLIIRKLKD